MNIIKTFRGIALLIVLFSFHTVANASEIITDSFNSKVLNAYVKYNVYLQTDIATLATILSFISFLVSMATMPASVRTDVCRKMLTM